MYSHQYDQHRAAKMQDATEEMIRMRRKVDPSRRVTVETADGWMVVSKMLRAGMPHQYDADHWLSLEEADKHFKALAAGEYRGWSPVAILPCKDGVPLGAKRVS